MSFSDAVFLGQIQSFLFAHRMLRTIVPKGKQFREGEKEIANYFRFDITGSEKAYLMDIFASFGFVLKIFDNLEYPGIPSGGQVWCLVRDPSSASPPWISSRRTLEALADKGTEPKKITVTWTFTVYLHYLYLAYTKLNRRPNEVSRFVDVVFTKEELVDLVRRYVDDLGENDAGKSEAVTILTSEKGQEIERRVGNVLKWLCSINHLDQSTEDEAYSQTVLGAAEVAEHYDQDFAYLLPPDSESVPTERVESIIRQEHDGLTAHEENGHVAH